MTDKTWLENALAEIEDLTPKTGYNVVGVDRMGKPGEALYFVAHYENKAQAERGVCEARGTLRRRCIRVSGQDGGGA